MVDLLNDLEKEEQPLVQEATYCGMIEGLNLLKEVWNWNRFGWKEIRGTILVGLIKDTNLYGNTSVSMGAVSVLQSALFSDEAYEVGFVNCGTGGNKYQLYLFDKYWRISKEFKPGIKCFSRMRAPGQEGLLTPTDVVAQINAELKGAPWHGRKIPVYGFITGKLREVWESTKSEALGEIARRIFQETGISQMNENAFITQSEEAALENGGIRLLYGQLARAKKIPSGNVWITAGMGQGSTQWSIGKMQGGFPAGLNDCEELPIWRGKMTLMLNITGALPPEGSLICLKSGFLLYSERNPELCESLHKKGKKELLGEGNVQGRSPDSDY
jgi:hypothetical protein